MGQEGAKDRLDMISREPRINLTWFQDLAGDMASREPTWAKKVPRID